jgi:uncharacterized protein YaiI (UPF0178 family)
LNFFFPKAGNYFTHHFINDKLANRQIGKSANRQIGKSAGDQIRTRNQLQQTRSEIGYLTIAKSRSLSFVDPRHNGK